MEFCIVDIVKTAASMYLLTLHYMSELISLLLLSMVQDFFHITEK